MNPIILKVRFNKNNFLSFTNLITKYKIFIFQFLTMRKRYIYTFFTKDSQDFQYDDDELNNSQSEEIEEFSENNNDNDKSEYEETDEETGEETDEETDE